MTNADIVYEGWIQTASGKKIDPMNPKLTDIDILDVTHALSMKCRYNGHSKYFFSVAHHSVLVHKLVDLWLKDTSDGYQAVTDYEMKMWALLHDAAEAYLADIPSPLKPKTFMSEVTRQGAARHEPEPFKEIENRLMRVIMQALSPATAEKYPVEPETVKYFDRVALKIEVGALMGGDETVEKWGLAEFMLPPGAPEEISERMLEASNPEHFRQLMRTEHMMLDSQITNQVSS